MKKFTWLFVALLGLATLGATGCGSKQGDHEMGGGKAISTEKLDVAVFGKGEDAKYCPVMGSPIPKGKGYVHTMKDGRKIKFCCAGCVAPVEKDPKKYEAFFY